MVFKLGSQTIRLVSLLFILACVYSWVFWKGASDV